VHPVTKLNLKNDCIFKIITPAILFMNRRLRKTKAFGRCCFRYRTVDFIASKNKFPAFKPLSKWTISTAVPELKIE